MTHPSAAHLSPIWTHLTDIVVERAEGCYLYDADDTRFLDFTSGIGVTNTGHCHPRVVRAVQEQAGKLLHGQTNIVYSRSLLALVEGMKRVVPPQLNSFFFSNSGAEAIEAAVKLARHATGRPNIIVFQGSFHGRTNLTMAMTTSKTVYRVGYQPLAAGIFVAPYPYSFHYGWDDETTTDFCLRELRHLLRSQSAPEETAAMVIEPILGEGGYVVPPARFLQGVRDICDEHGILLVLDEVQSGFGRSGRFFAFEHFAVQPDILVMAKGLASGLPMSAIAAPQALMDQWMPGTHGGTYTGNAVSAAAAAATIEVLLEESLVDNARARGEQLIAGLRDLQAEFPVMGDVRGAGLMVGVEFGTFEEPNTLLANLVQQGCLARQMLILTCGSYGNVIRWIPPLVVSEAQIEDALAIFASALAESVE